jgi:hypothetical protein
MNAITKFQTGLWITAASAPISTFDQGITRPDIIQELVYNNHCSDHCNNRPEKQPRKLVAQRLFPCRVTTQIVPQRMICRQAAGEPFSHDLYNRGGHFYDIAADPNDFNLSENPKGKDIPILSLQKITP